MATAKGNGDAPKRKVVVKPRPVYCMLRLNGDGGVEMDPRGKPVVGTIPEGFEGEGSPAITRKAEEALKWQDADQSLTLFSTPPIK